MQPGSNHNVVNNHSVGKKRKLATTLICLLFAAAGFFLGWTARKPVGQKPPLDFSYDQPPLREKDPKYPYISRLLSCSASGEGNFEEYKPLSTQISGLIDEKRYAQKADNISVYFYDFVSGRWVTLDENKKYFPSSLLKVPVMMAYYRLAQTRPEVLANRLFYDGTFDDNVKEDFKPLKYIIPGHSYSVDELINYMIVDSDNNAAHLLFFNLDPDYFEETFTDVGLASFKGGSGQESVDYMSVKGYSAFFRVLYNATYLNRSFSEKAMELLSLPDYPGGLLRAGLPESVPIAQKFGENVIIAFGKKELHDCGIVYHPKNPYLLCVMTKGSDFNELAGAIREISKIVYDWIDAPAYAGNNKP